jgi:hypothetical protein
MEIENKSAASIFYSADANPFVCCGEIVRYASSGVTCRFTANGSLLNLMKHYAIDEWADFSRGLTPAGERELMLAHLASECAKCKHLSGFSLRLASVAGSLHAVQVPESALRLARAIFPVRMQDRPKRGNRLPIELIFDSFLVPSPAGLRATWQVGWQGLYRAGDCSVDLRIEPEMISTKAAVIGQIANHVAPTEQMENLAISLKSGKEIVAKTVSNRFGEFQMEYEQRSKLKLCIVLKDSRSIEVPLKRFAAEHPAAKSMASAKQLNPERQ